MFSFCSPTKKGLSRIPGRTLSFLCSKTQQRCTFTQEVAWHWTPQTACLERVFSGKELKFFLALEETLQS
jgi:hypothetical protein